MPKTGGVGGRVVEIALPAHIGAQVIIRIGLQHHIFAYRYLRPLSTGIGGTVLSVNDIVGSIVYHDRRTEEAIQFGKTNVLARSNPIAEGVIIVA